MITLPPRPQGPVDNLGQLRGVAPDLLVVPVAVGGLHDHVVRPLEQHRVPDDGLGLVAQVAGEDDLFGDAVLGGPDLQNGGTQQVAASLKRTLTPSHRSNSQPYSTVSSMWMASSASIRVYRGSTGGRPARLPFWLCQLASPSWMWAESRSMTDSS